MYRNVFESKKYVEVYAADRISAELGLDRARMSELALLLGSDYTEVWGGRGYIEHSSRPLLYHEFLGRTHQNPNEASKRTSMQAIMCVKAEFNIKQGARSCVT